jgi:chromosome partitioning protein
VKILATYNIKGGVGKTAAAVNLAHRAAVEGNRVLVWDLDPQGATSFYFRVKPKVKGGGEALVSGRRDIDRAIKGTDHDRLDLVPADFSYRNLDLLLDEAKKPHGRLRRLLNPLRKQYDIVLLDCPPSISLASEAVFRASDALVVPVIPTTLSIRTFDQLDDFLAANPTVTRRLKVLGFFSMVDRRKKLHRELLSDLRRQRPDLLETQIPAATQVERMGVYRAPVAEFAPDSRAARAYRSLWSEISARL